MPGRTERKEASRLERRREDDLTERGRSADQTEPHHRKRRGKTVASHRFGLEMRWTHQIESLEWFKSWKWYKTAAQRDLAMATLNRNSNCAEYRPIER